MSPTRAPHVCPRCDRERLAGHSVGALCPSCNAFRREAVHRLERLKPTIERLAAALACARRIATIGTQAAGRWDEQPSQDVRRMIALLDDIEAELDTAADEWGVLLLSGN